jgi:hypothetical protein
VTTWEFKFGDYFDAEDPVAVWACTLAIAINDVVYSNNKVIAAEDHPWRRFYEWRVAVSHFNEACLHLHRSLSVVEIAAFLDGEPELRRLHDELLERYEEIRKVLNRIRNEAAFHYPYKSGKRAVSKALGQLTDESTTMGAVGSTRMKDMRLNFADDVIVHMVVNATGGTEDAYAAAAKSLGEGVALFARFANHALDAYFTVRSVKEE